VLHTERKRLCRRSKMLLAETVRVPLFTWALVREIERKTAHTQVTGLHMDDEGQIRASCWSEGFLRYERFDTERPQSVGE